MQQPGIPARLAAANTALSAGRIDEAIGHIAGALEENPNLPIKVYKILITHLLRSGRTDEGYVWANAALKVAPDDAEIHNFIGGILRVKEQLDEAVRAFDRALAIDPGHRGARMNKGLVLAQLSDGIAAEAILRELLGIEPASPALHRALGKALWNQGRFDDATASLRKAVALQPAYADAWLDLSALALDSGAPMQAIATLDEGIAANPDNGSLHEAKATMFRCAGVIDQIGPYLEALAGRFGNSAWYQHEYGRYHAGIDRRAANHHLRRAVELAPANVEYRSTLADSLIKTRGVDEGAYLDEAHALMSLSSAPLLPGLSKIAAEIFLAAADHASLEALGTFRDIGRQWALADHQTALLFQMPRVTGDEARRELLDQHRLWGEKAAMRAARHPIVKAAERREGSKIRIGFMSSDLRDHVVTHFVWPLFEHADRDRFEIYCYSFFRAPQPQPLQTRIASMVHAFRWQPNISDRDAAQMIADDDLDILFELGGSTNMNKIEVVAWKPARLCASWLGYPHSAGLDTIDYLLVDPQLNPPDPSLLIEAPLVMPQSWVTMSEQAFPDSHPIEALAPFRRNGCISFGTANNPYKYNDAMLRCWAAIVARVPGSRFVFVRPEGGSKVFRRNILDRFEAAGVTADRIDFRAVRRGHMEQYNDIDIALDTFPQTGGTTTCEALWMGVPTISLTGPALFERLSYSILHNAGLGDLCVATTAEYIDRAVALAADPDRIQALRTSLRDQLRSSPLGNNRQFAQDFYDLVANTVGLSRLP